MAHDVYPAWRKTAPGQGSADARSPLSALYHQVAGESVPELEREISGSLL